VVADNKDLLEYEFFAVVQIGNGHRHRAAIYSFDEQDEKFSFPGLIFRKMARGTILLFVLLVIRGSTEWAIY